MKNLKKFNESIDKSFDDNWREEEEDSSFDDNWVEEEEDSSFDDNWVEEEEEDPKIYWRKIKDFFTFKK